MLVLGQFRDMAFGLALNRCCVCVCVCVLDYLEEFAHVVAHGFELFCCFGTVSENYVRFGFLVCFCLGLSRKLALGIAPNMCFWILFRDCLERLEDFAKLLAFGCWCLFLGMAREICALE